ncbi:esterase/lipase family protein [Paraburkholderia susongensis]|uniref:Alpha/beta hydrolase family protein n=1 Tax=Paraburkholderia susongensis TaxID=1515439 RepID=A0A1X7LLC4_9BURK|nr:alpha/beta fold hydrolase [Paraburkholderia susongensis]SMG53959.1 Alpha/beta hydrolase family protein [Paraburkholderia susongensis]
MTRAFSSWMSRCLLLALLATGLLSGCAMVQVSSLGPEQYIAMRRGDILSTGRLSAATRDTLHIAALDENTCQRAPQDCINSISTVGGINVDRRLASLAELSLQMAIANTPANATEWSDAQFDLWLRAVRFAYAFLFLGQRTAGERAFEDRQTQVRDYYNYAVQELARALFLRGALDTSSGDGSPGTQIIAGWNIHLDLSRVRLPEGVREPREVIPASRLSFAGIRSIYRRDGLGAELVAVMNVPQPESNNDDDTDADTSPNANTKASANARTSPRAAPQSARASQPFREMPSPNVTALMWFSQGSLEQVLSSHDVVLSVYDPYREESIERHGQTVPLAANFSAGYGIWLARSGFAGQSLRTLFGRARGFDRPRIYLMQPFDPGRRIVLMLHGLASSPEAWVNVANDIQGDELLRQHFQVWQVYYPTNVPILVNLARIRRAVQETLTHFDPDGTSPASHGMVLIGHSMGGVLARLLVSSSDDDLWNFVNDTFVSEGTDINRKDERLNLLLRFTPMPQVERAIFIAAPHRGTPFARNRLSRWVANLVRLPLALMNEIDDVLQTATNIDSQGQTFHVPNSIEQLRDTDPLIRATSQLPISPQVCFHSIIARRRENGPLEDSNDGVVPYRSAHLAGALSEKVIVAGHSVQETPQAILEIRRILHEDIEQIDQSGEICGEAAASK